MCSDALKKAVKVMAITALVLAVLAVAGLYFTFCGGHPHGLC